MAADPASQRNVVRIACVSCGNGLDSWLSRHVCQECGEPQPVLADEDYFSVLGLERKFALDRARVEKRFYEASRALHPDRFMTANPEARKRSLERMSFLNQAYQTLKSPEMLREYVLARENVTLAKAQIPTELAEDWFEIQDVLSEEPDLAQALIPKFEEKLASVSARQEAEIRELENELDRGGFERSKLEKLAHAVQAGAYVRSLARDIERIQAKFGHARAREGGGRES